MQAHLVSFRITILLPHCFGVVLGFCASSAMAELTLFDDFNAYSIGNGSAGQQLADVTGGVWQQSPEFTANADILDQGGGDHFFAYGNTSFRGGFRTDGFSITDQTQGNLLYFQLRAAASSSVNASFGVAASADPTWFDDYRAQVLLEGNSIDGYQLLARDDAGFSVVQSGLDSDVWYDVTLDIDTSTDTYDVYFDTDSSPATLGTLVANGFGFRSQGGGSVAENLQAIFGLAGGDNESGQVDNIYFMQGSGIAEPEPLVLEVNTNGVARILNSSASDAKDINYYEVRSESGSLLTSWSGIDGDAPPSEFTWEQGEVGVGSTLLVEANLFGMTSLGPQTGVSIGTAYSGGAFLANQDLSFYYGLADGTTLLEGDVVYVAPSSGDFNNDGAVNLADYVVWRNNLGAAEDGVVLQGNGDGGLVDSSDYQLWKTHYGSAATLVASTPVPEPATKSLVFLALAFIRVWR